MKVFIHCIASIIVLFGFLLAGDLIASITHSPIPGAIIALLLLFIGLLALKNIPLFLQDFTDLFLPLLPLFILPSCVSIINFQALIEKELVALLLSVIIGLIVTIAITPKVFQFFIALTGAPLDTNIAGSKKLDTNK